MLLYFADTLISLFFGENCCRYTLNFHYAKIVLRNFLSGGFLFLQFFYFLFIVFYQFFVLEVGILSVKMFLDGEFLDYSFTVLLYKALHITDVVTLVKTIAAATLKVAVTFIVPGVHMLAVDEVAAVGFFVVDWFATADATAEAVSIAVAQSYIE